MILIMKILTIAMGMMTLVWVIAIIVVTVVIITIISYDAVVVEKHFIFKPASDGKRTKRNTAHPLSVGYTFSSKPWIIEKLGYVLVADVVYYV